MVSVSALIRERLSDIGLECEPFDEKGLLHQGEILICDESNAEHFLKHVAHLDIFVLSTFPSLIEGKHFLRLGAKGYGNIYMHKQYLLQALETIKNDKIWLYPELKASLA
jgi:hypothetical protein